MTSLQVFFGSLATFLAIIQVIPYILSIFKGRTKPSRSSYTIWLANESVLVLSYLASGASTTLGLYIILLFNSLLIFILSLKYGVGGLKPMDLVCMSFATLAIILWVTTNNASLAVYACLASSIIGYIPTIKKSYNKPQTEDKLSWVLYVLATLFNVFAINSLNPAIFLPPLLSLVMSATVLFLLLRKAPGLPVLSYSKKLKIRGETFYSDARDYRRRQAIWQFIDMVIRRRNIVGAVWVKQ